MGERGREELGTVIAGRYRLVDILGEGGMATVYCAVDRETCRAVAVKLIKHEGLRHPELHTRFHREARAIAKLQHDGFAQLLGWGIERDTPFMVMELVRGENLAAVLRRHARLNAPVALSIAIALCELIEKVHAHGLVHRDIKPSNIMVQSIPEARIKLIDFGIAKHLGEASGATMGLTHPMALTMEGMLLGTPPYTSPEQLRGHHVDVRTDIYAVGVLLYRMLTGEAPFRGRHPLATACLQLATDPDPPSAIVPFIAPELEAAIMRCLRPAPSERYASATELRAALSAVQQRHDEEPATIPTDRLRWLNPLFLVAVAVAGVASSVLAFG